jgi:3-oxoadipate enol-lactonase
VNSGSAAAEGAAIYYEDLGKGLEVVLIHAGVADSRMWDGVFEALAERFHAIRFDIRGFGRSAMTPGRFSYHHDLESLLDHLAVGRASLVGCSFGGQIAIDFALAHPDRVSSLVLVSAGIGGREPSEQMNRLRLEPPAIGRLGEIKVPTLVIVGDRDLPEMIEAGDRLASEIPNARRVVFPGTAHLVSMERPERFLEVVTEFLSEP